MTTAPYALKYELHTSALPERYPTLAEAAAAETKKRHSGQAIVIGRVDGVLEFEPISTDVDHPEFSDFIDLYEA